MRSCCREAVASLGLLLIAGGSVGAQRDRPATLRGTVVDDGRPLGTASVQIFGLKRSTSTSDAGAFRFDSLPPGRYWVGVRRIGYVPASFTVTLLADTVRELKITLEPAPYRLSDLEVSGGMNQRELAVARDLTSGLRAR